MDENYWIIEWMVLISKPEQKPQFNIRTVDTNMQLLFFGRLFKTHPGISGKSRNVPAFSLG